MKIFLTWSGHASHKVALAFHDWLSTVVPAANPFVSSDLQKGGRWQLELARELKDTNFGVLCVVPGNESSPWLNFEAGALSKSIDHSMVVPVLVGVEPANLPTTISQFQCTRCDPKDLLKLAENLNTACEQDAIPEKRLNTNFKAAWPSLKKTLDEVLQDLEATRTKTAEGEVNNEDDHDETDVRIEIKIYIKKLKGYEHALDFGKVAHEIGGGVSPEEVKLCLEAVAIELGYEIKEKGKTKILIEKDRPQPRRLMAIPV